MKNFALLACLFLFSFSAFSQADVKWGKVASADKESTFAEFFGEIDGNIYVLEGQPNHGSYTLLEDARIAVFNKDLTRINSAPIPFSDEYKIAKIFKCFVVGDKLYFAFYYNNKRDDASQVLISAFDQNLKMVIEPKVVISRDRKHLGEIEPTFTFSPDNNLILSSYDIFPNVRDITEHEFGFSVLDKNLDILHQATYRNKIYNHSFLTSQVINNDGDVSLLIQKKLDSPKGKGRKYYYEQSIMHFSNGKANPNILRLKIEEGFPFNNAKLIYTPDNVLYCVGFYDQGEIKTGALGFYIAKADTKTNTLSIVTSQQMEEEEYIRNFGSTNTITYMVDIKTKDVFVEKDGSFTVTGEFHFDATDFSKTTFFRDIVIVKTDQRKDVKSFSVIPKQQVRQYGLMQFYSIAVLHQDKSTYFTYTAFAPKKPGALSADMKPADNPKIETLYVVRQMPDGTLKQEYSSSNQSSGIYAIPVYSFISSSGRLYFAGVKDVNTLGEVKDRRYHIGYLQVK